MTSYPLIPGLFYRYENGLWTILIDRPSFQATIGPFLTGQDAADYAKTKIRLPLEMWTTEQEASP